MTEHKYGIATMPWKPRATVASELKGLPNAPSYAEPVPLGVLRASVSTAARRELDLLDRILATAEKNG